MSHVTRTPLSGSKGQVKGQGHQAALVGCSSHCMIYMDDTMIIMNIHGTSRAGRRRRKACRLWTGGGPQRAYTAGGAGHIVSPRAQLVI